MHDESVYVVYQEVNNHDAHYGQYDPYNNHVQYAQQPHATSSGTREKAKVALSTGPSISGFIKWYAFHFIALGATASVLYVNSARIYSWDEGTLSVSDGTVMNLLQFAAKLVEILIVASISMMIMQNVVRRMAGPKGVPLGLIVGAYQCNSLQYFASSELRSSMSKARWLSIGVMLAAVYSNIIGPSSAAAIIPRLTWWDQDNPFNATFPPTLVISAAMKDLYPAKMANPNMTQLRGCDALGYDGKCPGAAFDIMKDWVSSWYNTGIMPGMLMTERLSQARRNVTIATFNQDSPRLANVSGYAYESNITIASTVIHPLVGATALFSNFARRTKVGPISDIKRPKFAIYDSPAVKLPVVQVQCAWYNYTDAMRGSAGNTPRVAFPAGVFDKGYVDSASDSQLAWTIDPKYWNFKRDLNVTNFTWIDISQYPNSATSGASLGALFTLPILSNDSPETVRQQSALVPCLINAKWASANVELDSTADNVMMHNVVQKDVFEKSTSFLGSSKSYGGSIYISPTWARLLDVPYVVGTSASQTVWNTTMVQALMRSFIVEEKVNSSSPWMHKGDNYTALQPDSDSGHQAVAPVLAGVVVEGLSRHTYLTSQVSVIWYQGPDNITGYNLATQATFDHSAAQSLNATNVSIAQYNDVLLNIAAPMNVTILRYGYGYGLKSQPATVVWGLAMLSLHALFATLYLGYVFLFGCFRGHFTARAWGNVGHMIALALVSRSARDRLPNIGAGVDKSETWKETVRIRVKGQDELQLVVDEYFDETLRPEANKKYR